MATARERSERPYEDGGGFGKFRKRPFRRTSQATPYDRPPTALRNPIHGDSRSSNWLSKLMDPAHRLISSSAHKLFAPFFRKRLPPPPPPDPTEPAANQRAMDKQPEAVPTERLGMQGAVVNRCDNPSNSSGGGGVTELELILKQQTFTRSEIDRLTALLQSRSIDLPDGDEEKKSEVIPSQVVLYQNKKEFPKTPVKNNGIENGLISTPTINSSVLDQDIASPAELAKSYMGSRPSNVSPSMLGLCSHPLRENSTALITHPLTSKLTTMPVVGDEGKKSEVIPSQVVLSQNKKEFPNTPFKNNGIENCLISTPTTNSSVLDQDIASPAELAKAYMGSRPSKVSPSMLGLHNQRLRENSTSLISHPFTSKSPTMSVVPRSSARAGFPENGFVTPRSRGRSAIYSMARTPYSRVHSTATIQGSGVGIDALGGQSSSSQSMWENNRFSGSKQGPLKRRSSVLDNDTGSVGPIRRIRQKSNLLPTSGSLSIHGAAFGSDAAQHPSLTGKAILVGEPSTENGDNDIQASGSTIVPSKSSEMASKILQQLDVLVSSREKSPAKLSPSMLSGQALRSMETVDSSKFLENFPDNNKLDVKQDTSLPDTRDFISQKQENTEEKGPSRSIATYDNVTSAINDADTTSLAENSVPGVKTIASPVTNSIAQPSLQKKRAFQMSAHEDYLELDDDDNSNGTAYIALAEGSKKLDTTLGENESNSVEIITEEKPPAIPEVKNPLSSILNQKSVGTDMPVVAEKGSGFTFPAAPLPTLTVQQAVVDGKSTAVIDKAGLLKESNAASPIFSFRDKVVSPKEPNGASPTSNFSCKTGDKVPQFTFSSSSSGIKLGSSSDPKPEYSSITSGVTESVAKENESDKADDKNDLKGGVLLGSSETMPSAVSTSSSTTSIFSFGITANSSTPNNGSLASTTSSFFSPSPPLFSSNVASPNSSGSSTNSVASSTSNGIAVSATTANIDSTSSLTMSASAPSFTAAPIFKFGSSVVPSTSASSVSATTSIESTETKAKETGVGNLTVASFGGTSSSITSTGSSLVGGTSPALTSTGSNIFYGTSSALTSTGSNIFGGTSSAISSNGSSIFGGTSSAVTSTGSNLFSFNSGAANSAAANQSQGFNPFSSGSAQTSAAGTAFASSTQSIPIQFGSSALTSFGLSGNTAISSGSSLFSSTSAAKLFSSGSTFGTSSTSSFSEASSVGSSNSTTTAVFGTSWSAPKTPVFGSTFNSSSASSTGFAFGAPSMSSAATNSTPSVFGSSSSGASSSGSIFPFSSPPVATSSQPVFGNPNPGFPFGSSPSGNNDQMNMEDSMAEDTVQATTPAVPVFDQQPMSSGFIFGSTAPSGGNQFGSTTPTGASPFQFGSQPNLAAPQSPSPFQASGSLEFNAGGSFSLGTGGGDKSTRKFVKVRKTQRKK